MVDCSKAGFISPAVDRIGIEMEMDEKGLIGELLFGGLGDGVLSEQIGRAHV